LDSDRVKYVFSTYSVRIQYVFSTYSPRIQYVFTTYSYRRERGVIAVERGGKGGALVVNSL